MTRPPIAQAVLAAVVVGTTGLASVGHASAQVHIAANTNVRPAGVQSRDGLILNLVAASGLWRPEEGDGPSLEVAALGEEGGPLVIPAPLIRVDEGSLVVVRVRNRLLERLDVHGLFTHLGTDDTVVSVPPGESREVRFAVGKAGTYHYWASTRGARLDGRAAIESQLGGAFVVDPPHGGADDRVFVISEWNDGRTRPDGKPDFYHRVFAINGRSWPHTERLTVELRSAVRWHLVNLSQDVHPMHLHGFYFTVEAAGDGRSQTTYGARDSRRVVTELMPIGSTRRLAWTPDRPGNWLFHCHSLGHVTPALRFWMTSPPPPDPHDAHASHAVEASMAGLVMGVTVRQGRMAGMQGEPGSHSPSTRPASTRPARRLVLTMHRKPGYWDPEDALAFGLGTGTSDTSPDDATVPGPLLVLTRGQPVEILLKNELSEATAIHWHGIELQSRFDGVPGWSGAGGSITPAIEAGGSFLVRFTPPRAGTFIYHTHAHDAMQLASGLYGALIVLSPNERFDATRDHILMLGMEGPKDPQADGHFPVVINGSPHTGLTVKAGIRHRFRLINITTAFSGLHVRLASDIETLTWRQVAKDGADIPRHQQTVRPADLPRIGVGETYDFIVEGLRPGDATISVRRDNGALVQQVPVRIVP